jgi:N-acylglucosamine-6-phosphate 2-epimerase
MLDLRPSMEDEREADGDPHEQQPHVQRLRGKWQSEKPSPCGHRSLPVNRHRSSPSSQSLLTLGSLALGIVKRAYAGFDPYITVTEREVQEAAAAGADIIAFDATLRPRPGGITVAALVAMIRARGALPMADCADLADARAAAALVASTLCGYTDATRGTTLPALDLVRAMRAGGPFVVCEGGVASPEDVRRAFAAGADAVVGTAITNVDVLVRRFVAAAPDELGFGGVQETSDAK